MRRLAAFLVLSAALALAGCGFTPLYATPGVSPTLASVQVVRPDGRAGHLLGQHLEDALARDPAHPAVYRLEMNLNEARYPRGVRVDNIANRYELRLTADYKLVRQADAQVVKAGAAAVTVSYDSADQPYAGIAAQLDGQDRAAAELARKIQLDLAAFLARGR